MKKTITILLFLVLLTAILPVAASASENTVQSDGNVLTVSIDGKSEGVPDRAVLYFNLYSVQPTASGALKECRNKLKQAEEVIRGMPGMKYVNTGIRFAESDPRMAPFEQGIKGIYAYSNFSLEMDGIRSMKKEELDSKIAGILDNMSGTGASLGEYRGAMAFFYGTNVRYILTNSDGKIDEAISEGIKKAEELAKKAALSANKKILGIKSICIYRSGQEKMDPSFSRILSNRNDMNLFSDAPEKIEIRIHIKVQFICE